MGTKVTLHRMEQLAEFTFRWRQLQVQDGHFRHCTAINKDSVVSVRSLRPSIINHVNSVYMYSDGHSAHIVSDRLCSGNSSQTLSLGVVSAFNIESSTIPIR